MKPLDRDGEFGSLAAVLLAAVPDERARPVLEAVLGALPPDVARGLESEMLEDVARLVCAGACSIEQGVEAITLAVRLGKATDDGEITESAGLAQMIELALRHHGTPPH